MWPIPKKKVNAAPQEEDSTSMERADAALDDIHTSHLKSRGLLFYLKKEAAANHFSLNFITMVEKGRPRQ